MVSLIKVENWKSFCYFPWQVRKFIVKSILNFSNYLSLVSSWTVFYFFYMIYDLCFLKILTQGYVYWFECERKRERVTNQLSQAHSPTRYQTCNLVCALTRRKQRPLLVLEGTPTKDLQGHLCFNLILTILCVTICLFQNIVKLDQI